MQTFRAVCLLHNLTLDGKLCLRDDKKCCLCVTSSCLIMAGEPGKRHDVRAHYPEVVRQPNRDFGPTLHESTHNGFLQIMHPRTLHINTPSDAKLASLSVLRR